MIDTPLRDEKLVYTYPDHESVQHAVTLLADHGFPVRAVRVEGRDVRVVELITERVTPWRATAAGALRGLWVGAAIGLIVGLAVSSVVLPIVCGVVVGMMFGAVFTGLSLPGSRRGLVTTQAIQAGSYDLWVETELHDRALDILGRVEEMPAEDGASFPPPGPATAEAGSTSDEMTVSSS
jgi:hypothetical protein